MSFRILDGNNDWTFGAGISNYAIENNEIAFDVKTRVLSFYNDCFFDTEAGIDYFNLLDYNSEKDLENAIEREILTTNGVLSCNRINVYVNANRKMSVEYEITTIYSTYNDNFELSDLNV